MKIYVKDNVERIAGDDETARKLEEKGFKAVKSGEKVIPSLIPKAPEPPTPVATASVQRRRRYQRKVAE